MSIYAIFPLLMGMRQHEERNNRSPLCRCSMNHFIIINLLFFCGDAGHRCVGGGRCSGWRLGGKAVGADEVPGGASRCLGNFGAGLLYVGVVRTGWRQGLLIPISKGKGDIQEFTNYRAQYQTPITHSENRTKWA